MPNINSFADLVLDQEKLLRAFEDNSEILAPAEPQRAAVHINVDRLQEVKARQDSFAARRQEATQELVALMYQAREDARRLRALVKGLLGTRNERLVQFQVAPVRSRPRNTAVVKTAPPVAPQAESQS
jgi:hypothetical protein